MKSYEFPSDPLVKAVDEVVNRVDSQGYVSVLYALAVLMGSNPNEVSQKAGALVKNLAVVLDDYLLEEDEENEDDE